MNTQNASAPATKLTPAQMLAMIAKLEAEKAALLAKKKRPFTLKVSEKAKALSVYGLQRFPVTLYASAMEELLSHAEEIKTFIAAHPELARKTDEPTPTPAA